MSSQENPDFHFVKNIDPLTINIQPTTCLIARSRRNILNPMSMDNAWGCRLNNQIRTNQDLRICPVELAR
jgi:hypothetical protein